MLIRTTVGRAPALCALDKGAAQGIVMHDQRLQCGQQQRYLQRLVRLQHRRLVPVMTLGNLIGKKTVLHRQQQQIASQRRLIHLHHTVAFPRDRRQALHRLMLEQLFGRETHTGLAGAADQLNRNDRIAAQFEEIIMQAHLRQT